MRSVDPGRQGSFYHLLSQGARPRRKKSIPSLKSISSVFRLLPRDPLKLQRTRPYQFLQRSFPLLLSLTSYLPNRFPTTHIRDTISCPRANGQPTIPITITRSSIPLRRRRKWMMAESVNIGMNMRGKGRIWWMWTYQRVCRWLEMRRRGGRSSRNQICPERSSSTRCVGFHPMLDLTLIRIAPVQAIGQTKGLAAQRHQLSSLLNTAYTQREEVSERASALIEIRIDMTAVARPNSAEQEEHAGCEHKVW